MRGVFLDRDALDGGDIDITPLAITLPDWVFHGRTRDTEVGERIAEADVVVSNKAMLDAAALARAPKLRLICISATGTNNVDLEAARNRGIVVCNVRSYATASVVEHVFALLLSLRRRLPAYRDAVSAGGWQRSPQFTMLDFPIGELHGSTLGIVGYGELGRAVAQVAEAFGMRILVATRDGGSVGREGLPLHALLPQVDALSLHLPLNAQTRGLIGAAELALMKSTAVLINTARGGIVDEQALADALRAGRLGGAGIDVLTTEPPVAGNPLLAADIPNLIVTPHIAWASREARQRLVMEVAANIRAFLAGEMRNRVA